MGCLIQSVSFDIFTDNYFTSFGLLTHLRINNMWETGMLNKSKLRKCTIIGHKLLQNKEPVHFEQRTSSKKAA